MKLSVIVVNYNVKFYIEQCLISLRRSLTGIESEIYVVDNASEDGSVEYLTDRFPEVFFISSNYNLGFAKANNMAIRQSKGEYILLLNPDTIVGEKTIANLIAFMDDKSDIGGVGVRMMTEQGIDAKESRRGVPTPLTAFYKMCGLCAKYPASKRFASYYMGHLSWDEPAEIEIVSGAFFAVSRKAIEKIGLLDEDYFMYGEDVDLSYRLLKGGFHNWYLPSRILHYKGESTQKTSFRYVHVFYKAMFIFLRKHFGGMSLLLSLPIKAAIYFKALAVLLTMQAVRMKQNLGFFQAKASDNRQYVFIGQQKAMKRCEDIAKRKGLHAQFVESTYHENPLGHLTLDLPKADDVCVVYDLDSYSFEQMFDIFARHPQPNIRMGTYNNQTQIAITGSEILL